jgi:hypothetical protein
VDCVYEVEPFKSKRVIQPIRSEMPRITITEVTDVNIVLYNTEANDAEYCATENGLFYNCTTTDNFYVNCTSTVDTYLNCVLVNGDVTNCSTIENAFKNCLVDEDYSI